MMQQQLLRPARISQDAVRIRKYNGAGLHFAKKEMHGKEYFKGDGTVPWWVTSVSIFATLLSPISFLSLAGNSYAGTWIMWFAQLGMLLAIPLTIKFFLPIYSKLDIDTAYHYLELRFHSKFLRVLGAMMFIIYQVGRMSIIMYLPCMVLSSLMGINVNILIIIIICEPIQWAAAANVLKYVNLLIELYLLLLTDSHLRVWWR